MEIRRKSGHFTMERKKKMNSIVSLPPEAGSKCSIFTAKPMACRMRLFTLS